MTKKRKKQLPTKADIQRYEMLTPILNSIFNEIKELSKKKQDGLLNKLKVKMINRVLQKIKDILSAEPVTEFLDLLDEETLPTNSDAALIIAQYDAAMKQFKSKYYIYDELEEEYKWSTK